MINLERDIRSLTEFIRNTNDLVKQMKETRSPRNPHGKREGRTGGSRRPKLPGYDGTVRRG